jgi:DNA modification methylase
MLPDSCVDAVVTDPPYEIGMRDWDKTGIAYNPDVWLQCLRVLKPGGYLAAFGGSRTYHRIACAIEDAGFYIQDQVMWIYSSGLVKANGALKPAHEPIAIARKMPSISHLNIDAVKIDRWPANVVHDGSDDVLVEFPDAPGQIARARTDGTEKTNRTFGKARNVTKRPDPRTDGGSAARFFYCARASGDDRGTYNDHPTVKPRAVMSWILGLVAVPGDLILDPFMGSGSTGKASVGMGMKFVGIDLSHRFVSIANRRVTESHLASAQAALL